MSEILTDHMRLALVLRRAIGTGAADSFIVNDARELILASRRLAAGGDGPAIMRRVGTLMQSYGLKPLEVRGRIILPLPGGVAWEVPA
jgi:hypothetical protein